MNNLGSLSKSTQFVHHERARIPDGNQPLVSPIYQSVKYTPVNMSQLRSIMGGRHQGFLYSRISNPTVHELEILLARLQGRDDAIATASGIAAITAVAMTFLSAGDRAVVFTESYKPTRFLLNGILARFGVETIRLSRDDYAQFESLCSSSRPPKMVFLESPTNPTLRVHDLRRVIKSARSCSCLTALDNTFAGFTAHGDLDIDLYVHSLTKQASGHSDAMGGIVIGKKALIDKVFPVAMTIGGCLDPNSAWLILRGMKTYGLRTRESSKIALELAQWISLQTWAENVRYPALPNHPDHELWKSQNPDGGSVITFDLRCDNAAVDKFFDSLRLFAITPSLGCVESLAVPCLALYADDLPAQEARDAGINERTVRLAIGIEDIADLKADLVSAVAATR